MNRSPAEPVDSLLGGQNPQRVHSGVDASLVATVATVAVVAAARAALLANELRVLGLLERPAKELSAAVADDAAVVLQVGLGTLRLARTDVAVLQVEVFVEVLGTLILHFPKMRKRML